MKPDFIVIGAQKAASTFIQTTLQAHPDVFLPDGETPYFEDPDYCQTPRTEFNSIFAGRTESKMGIKRPNYIGKPEVPPRIHADFPNIKLVATLRNPITRAVAAYFHQIKYGTLPPLPLEEGLNRILDGDELLLKRFPRAAEVLEFGLYHKYLCMYQPYLRDHRLLIILHDDILADSLTEVKRLYRFLEVSDDFIPPDLDRRPQKVIYSIPRLRFLSCRNRYLHSYNANRTRLVRRQLAPHEFAYVGAITAIDRYLLARIFPSQKPHLSNTLRQRLQAFYADDISRLSDMIDRDLSRWQ